MKKSDYIEITRKLWHIADSGNYPSVRPHYFDVKERKLLKELIRKINKNMEVIIDDMGEHDKTIGSD